MSAVNTCYFQCSVCVSEFNSSCSQVPLVYFSLFFGNFPAEPQATFQSANMLSGRWDPNKNCPKKVDFLVWVFWWSNNKWIQISEIVVSNTLRFAPPSYLFHVGMVDVENNMEKTNYQAHILWCMVVSVDHAAPIYLVGRIKQLNQTSLTLCTQRSKLWPVSRHREKTLG